MIIYYELLHQFITFNAPSQRLVPFHSDAYSAIVIALQQYDSRKAQNLSLILTEKSQMTSWHSL